MEDFLTLQNDELTSTFEWTLLITSIMSYWIVSWRTVWDRIMSTDNGLNIFDILVKARFEIC